MKIEFNWPDSVPEDQIDRSFIQGMLDRMSQGFYTYGHARQKVEKSNNRKNVEMRFDRYEQTGNTEFLMDASNFCMMEFMVPGTSNAYFKETPPEESPGKLIGGKVIRNQNELLTRGTKRREGD